MEGQPPVKRAKLENSCKDDLLQNFLEWLKEEGILVSQKLKISKLGSCARYGAIAAENIDSDEVLFTIPRYEQSIIQIAFSFVQELWNQTF